MLLLQANVPVNPDEYFLSYWFGADSDLDLTAAHHPNPFGYGALGSIYGFPRPQYEAEARDQPRQFFTKVVGYLQQANVQGLHGYIQAGPRIYEIDKQGRWSEHTLPSAEQLPRIHQASCSACVPGRGVKLSVCYTAPGPATCFKLYIYKMGRVVSVPVTAPSSATGPATDVAISSATSSATGSATSSAACANAGSDPQSTLGPVQSHGRAAVSGQHGSQLASEVISKGGRAAASSREGKWAAIWLPEEEPPPLLVQVQTGRWSSTPFRIARAQEKAR